MSQRLFDIAAPKTSVLPERLFLMLHGTLKSWGKRMLGKQPWIEFLTRGEDGKVRFSVAIPEEEQRLITNALRATYPGVELYPVNFEEKKGLVAWLGTASPYLPIQQHFHGDSLAGLIHTLAETQKGERIAVSLKVRAKPSGWQNRSYKWAYNRRQSSPPPNLWELTQEKAKWPQAVEKAKLAEEKARNLGFDCILKVKVVAPFKPRAKALMHDTLAVFRVFHNGHSGLVRQRWPEPFLLTPPELAALWHLPIEPSVHTDFISSPKYPAPDNIESGRKTLGVANYPGRELSVTLTDEDHRRHLWVAGPTGTGKSTLLLNLALQDIRAGRGCGVIDPKGDLVRDILARLPQERLDDVVLVTPDDGDMSIGLNPLEWSDPSERDLIADNALAIFRRLYEDYWGIRTDDILKSAFVTLLSKPDSTLCDILLLLSDEDFRRRMIRKIPDPVIVSTFWKWYEGLSERGRLEAIGPVMNKLRDLLMAPRVRRILCQPRSTVDLKTVIDGGKILLADLSTGAWGEHAASLVGSFLVHKVWQGVRSRSAIPNEKRRDFFLYVDEFQQFQGIAGPFADTLALARGFHLSLTMANQHLGQLSRELSEAVLANARSKVVFQLGMQDAGFLSREFAPLDAQALQNTPKYEAVARLSVQGETSRPFTFRTMPPSGTPDPAIASEAAARSRQRFGRPVSDIDRELIERIGNDGNRTAIQ